MIICCRISTPHMDSLHTFRDVPVTMLPYINRGTLDKCQRTTLTQRMQHFLSNIWSTLVKGTMTIRLIGRPSESRHQLAEGQFQNEDIVPMGPHTGLSQFYIGSSETMGRLLLKRSRSKRSSVCPEALIWPKVPEHLNILPFLGTFKLGKNRYEYHVSGYLDPGGLHSANARGLETCLGLTTLSSAGVPPLRRHPPWRRRHHERPGFRGQGYSIRILYVRGTGLGFRKGRF